jgi:glycosyltransferase involved in cell wall biosynthesis
VGFDLPKVTILLPVYNGERYLAAAIESALNQSYSDFELLIADDASTDSSAKIIEKYGLSDSRIKTWRNDANKGLFGNYNECLRRSGAQYVKPFAQDDLLEPKALASMVSLFESDGQLALVSCARRCIDAQGREIKVLRELRGQDELGFDEVLADNLLNLTNKIGEPSAVMFRREYAANGFDETFYHLGDIEYWFRIIEHGKYRYLDEVLCSFRQHSGSTTSKNAKGLRFALDMLRLGGKYRTFLDRTGLTDDAYARLVAEATAAHLKFLTRHKGVSLQDLLTVEHTTTDSARSDLEGFKELLFYALLIAGETMEENYALKKEWEAERNRLEDQLAKLLKSRSWKLTVPLRGAVKVLRWHGPQGKSL